MPVAARGRGARYIPGKRNGGEPDTPEPFPPDARLAAAVTVTLVQGAALMVNRASL